MNQIESILNYRKNSESLSSSGQPTEKEFLLIKEMGFEVIINLRPESEMLYDFDEKLIVESLGMKYVQIPMTFDTLNNEIISKLFQILEEENRRNLFIHCHHNIRASVLLALYQIIILGWKTEDAYKELKVMMEITAEVEAYISTHITNFCKEK